MNMLPDHFALLSQSLAWALVHSLWQGLIMYATLYIALRLFPAISARVKYGLSYGALALVALWFADTWVSRYQELKGSIVMVSTSGSQPATNLTYSIHTTTVHATTGSVWKSMIGTIEHNYTLIIILYSIGLLFMLGRLLASILHVHNLRTKGLMPLAEQYHDLLEKCMSKLAMMRPVGFYLSNAVTTPMIVGALKPIILLPIATINHLSTDQVEAILLHELAHIKRNDYLLNMLQAVIETLLFFNPFVWLVSAITRREREHCCDDLAVACTGNPLPYAKALAALEINKSARTLALGAAGKKSHLLHRIKRIMEMKTNNTNSRVAVIMASIFTIALSAAIFAFTPSFAQKAKKQKADTVVTSVYRYKTVTIDSNGHKSVIEKVSSKPLHEADISNDEEMAAPPAPPIPPVPPMPPTPGMNQTSHTTTTTKVTVRNNDKTIVKRHVTVSEGDAEAQTETEIEEAAAEVEKATANATASMNTIHWDEITKAMNESMADLKSSLANKKISKQVRDTVMKVYVEAVAAVQESAKEIAKNAKKEAHTTKSKLIIVDEDNDYQAMIELMKKEKLISQNGTYSIEKNKDALYINGEKQSIEVYKRYKNYLSDKNVTIRGDKHSQTIDIHN